MKAMTGRNMKSHRRMETVFRNLRGRMHRMMTNHNVHVITHHGNVRLGRKGRTG